MKLVVLPLALVWATLPLAAKVVIFVAAAVIAWFTPANPTHHHHHEDPQAHRVLPARPAARVADRAH